MFFVTFPFVNKSLKFLFLLGFFFCYQGVRAGTVTDYGEVSITAQVGTTNPGGGEVIGDSSNGNITGSVGFIIFPRIIETISPFPDIVLEPIPRFCTRKADLNCDGMVNIIDFSMLIYWFNRSPASTRSDLNNDGVVDIADFSIMAFYWTN